MQKKTIFFKTKTLLIKELIKKDLIEVFKEANIFTKFLKKESFPDIYFHSGDLDEKAISYIKNSKITIVNCFSSMNLVLAKTKISHEKVKVIYPSIDIEYKKPKEIKSKYLERLNIQENTKLIFFTAKNFKNAGIKEFLEICSSLSFFDFKIIIAGNKQQLNALEFILPKYPKLQDKILSFDDKENIDELFLISDIFLLPSYTKPFAVNILKAMFCKCLVFLPMNNDAKEIIDVYLTMDNPNDPSTTFKIDAILYDEKELKKLKKENRKIAKECVLENNLAKFMDILSKI